MLRDWFRTVQFLAVGLVCFLLICAQVKAQEGGGEDAKPDPAAKKADTPKPAVEAGDTEEPAGDAPASETPAEKPKTETPAEKPETKPPAEKPEAKTPAEVSPPAKPEPSPAGGFDAKFAEWKELLKQLRKLRADYRTAEPSQTADIERQWGELIVKGEALVPELREAGEQEYAAAPNENGELVDFLVKLVADDVNRDDCESALKLAGMLLDNGCEKKELYEPTGMAAFGVNDFEKAKEYLQKAKDEDAISDAGKPILEKMDEFAGNWTKEQDLRQKEAEADDLPRVRLTTTKGDIVIELFENEAPDTVGNFVSLVEQKFYDGLTFHRVLSGFMAQGGCPKGDGTAGPGYHIRCECYKTNHRQHYRGSLSMAHSGRDTGGSQFFITFRPTPHLDGMHTVFGRVIEGMDVVGELQLIDPDGSGTKPQPDKIVEAKVVRKRDHEYKPNKAN